MRNGSAHGAQPAEAGVRKTAESLGVDEKTVRNAEKIATITPDAKTAAIDAGLDNNRSALLDAAVAESISGILRAPRLSNSLTTLSVPLLRHWRRPESSSLPKMAEEPASE